MAAVRTQITITSINILAWNPQSRALECGPSHRPVNSVHPDAPAGTPDAPTGRPKDLDLAGHGPERCGWPAMPNRSGRMLSPGRLVFLGWSMGLSALARYAAAQGELSVAKIRAHLVELGLLRGPTSADAVETISRACVHSDRA